MKRPSIAALLSAILPGLGQFYNRDWMKGIGFLIVGFLLSGLAAQQISVDVLMAGDPSRAWRPLFLLLVLLGFMIWSIVDAYRSAKASLPPP